MDMLKTAKTYILAALTAASALLAFTSCESLYDEEGDCTVKYMLKFRYDMNLKWADAFPSEVHSVNLYVFDGEGVFVKEYTARGEALAQPDYRMQLDLPAGDYRLVAWCGLENGDGTEADVEKSFIVPQPEPGVTTIEELTCTLNTKATAADPACSDTRLDFLFHGYMEVSLPDTQDGKEYVYTMPLVKDTNHIRIILQQLSGDDMAADDYDIRIDAANGVMGYDNALIDSCTVTYRPWAQTTAQAGVGKDETDSTRAVIYVEGVMADFSVGRMMAAQHKDMMLTIVNRKSEESIIARVPIIEYALLSKEYYEMAYGHAMSDQEFMDREDEYVLTFFLDRNGRWLDASILIHSWRIVLHEYGLGS